MLDLGSGSGLLAVLLAQRGHFVTALDIEPDAARNTWANARANGVSVLTLQSDWDDALRPNATFDFVVCNPPFLTEEPPRLRRAVFGGENLEHTAEALHAIRRRLRPSARGLVLSNARTGRDLFRRFVEQAALRIVETQEFRWWWERHYVDTLMI